MDITSFLLGFTKGKNSGGSSSGDDSSTPSVGVNATGEVKGTGGELTITHGLGAVPDIIAIIVNPAPNVGEAQFQFHIGFSQALIDRFGEGMETFAGGLSLTGTATMIAGVTTSPIDGTGSFLGGIKNANASTFQVGVWDSAPISDEKTVKWYAVAGLT